MAMSVDIFSRQETGQFVGLAILSGAIALLASWLLIEGDVDGIQRGTFLEYVLVLLTFAIPVVLTAILAWKNDLSIVVPVCVGVIIYGVLVVYLIVSAEAIWVLLLLFTIPAFIAGYSRTGLPEAILLTYAPVFGILFAVPIGRLGEPTFLDRMLTGVIFGFPVVLLAVVLYFLGTAIGYHREES